MDRAIVLSVLLLVALTWLLYKLAVMLEPRGEKRQDVETSEEAISPGVGGSARKPIYQRLRK